MSAIDRSAAPPPGPVRPFAFPAVDSFGLDNGLEVLAATHGDLPLVTAALVIGAGAEHEPPGSGGLAHLVVNALETGIDGRDAEAIAWELELLGVELHADATWEAAILSLSVPRRRLEAALEVFAAVARQPSFPEEEVRRLRDEQLADILQRRKEPRALANDMAARFIFARDVPYRRPLIGSATSVEALDAAAVRAFHGRHFAPGAAALILTGDIDGETARGLAATHFGDWSGAAADAPDFAVRPHVEHAGIFIVNRPAAVQSEIRIGHVGVERHHPDYFALVVMNTLLGGAFTSRLNMSLRERHGFTYGARSGFAFRRRPGPFVVQVAVGTEVTAPAVREAVREVRGLREGGPTEEEVSAARDYLTGVLPLQLETNEQLAGRLADLVVFDLPADYFEHWRERINAITPADVHRVAREHLRPDQLAVVVVGDAARIRQPLDELGIGPVEVHD